MSGRYSIEYHCHLRVESYFSRILFAALYFEVLVDLALGCGLSSQTSKGGIDASADLEHLKTVAWKAFDLSSVDAEFAS